MSNVGRIGSIQRILVILAVIAGLLATITYLVGNRRVQEIGASIELAEAMGGDTTGFDRADRIREFHFPADYGAHPGYKTEWWYYTGNRLFYN